MVGEERTARHQVALCILALLLLNAPILVVVDRAGAASSAPITPIYLFLTWLAVIAAAAINLRRRES
jgi:hypothetical protein